MLKHLRKILNRPENNNLRVVIDLFGAIAAWWGLWGLLDLLVSPKNKLLSYIISIIFGLILLFLDGNGLDDLK